MTMPEAEAPSATDPAALEDGSVWLRPPIDRIGLVLGPAVLVGWLFLVDQGTLTPQAHRLAGILLMTVIWWLTEPIPIPVTGILAVVLCVLLGAVPTDEATSPAAPATVVLASFAEPSVFFLLGGLFIGRAMARHGLDRRIALMILCTDWAGRSPGTVLAATGLAVMFLSMWISNTAATAIMYPVILGVVAVLAAGDPRSQMRFARSPYASALLLMTAYASSVGGIATPIGTATNVVAIGYFKRPEYFSQQVDFLRWSLVGVPLMLLLFASLYAWLRLQAPANNLDLPRLRGHLRAEYDRLGPWKVGECNTLSVFLIVVSLWVAPGVLALVASPEAQRVFSRHCPEEITALLAPVLLFLLPVDWKRRQLTLEASDLRQVDWGIVLLFGAGLALGSLMFKTGLAQVIGRGVFELLGTRDVWVITAAAIAGGILLSEFTGNAATASTLIPVILATCVEAEIDRLPPLLGVTFGASFGSALPVSTPPNAIVYSSGLVPVRRMVLAGIGLDLLCLAAIWTVLRIADAVRWTPFVNE
jgi:sodium-dependent dicarboxylate transporter 2/3/5